MRRNSFDDFLNSTDPSSLNHMSSQNYSHNHQPSYAMYEDQSALELRLSQLPDMEGTTLRQFYSCSLSLLNLLLNI